MMAITISLSRNNYSRLNYIIIKHSNKTKQPRMSSTINTSKGEQPIDPYKAKSLEDPPLAQKVEDLVDFISEAKFGMLTTKIAGSEYLTSRCMALAGKVLSPLLSSVPPSLRSSPGIVYTQAKL